MTLQVSRILWGTNYENQLLMEFPLDQVLTDRELRGGSELVKGTSGYRDAWKTAADYVLEADWRWIPDVDQTVGTPRTGLSSSGGWQEFLDYARDKNDFRFVPDVLAPDFYIPSCRLVEPMRGFGSPESDATRKLRMKIRNPTYGFAGAVRGLFFNYSPGVSLTLFNVTRSGVGNYHGGDGLVAQAAANVLRDRDYFGSSRVALAEGLRTNLISQNENPAVWSVTNTPIITTGQADPRGGTNAVLIEDDNAGAVEFAFRSIVLPTAGTQAFAVYVRQGTSAFSDIGLQDETAAVNKVTIRVDWAAGTASVSTGSGTMLAFEPAMYLGWRRLLFNATTITAGNTHRLRMYGATAAGASVGSTYYFGPQAEDATFPSSYIVTDTGTITRPADTFTWPYWLWKPQAMWVYVDMTEMGMATLSGFQRVLGLGTSGAATARVFNIRMGNTPGYSVAHESGAGTLGVSSNIPAGNLPLIGDRVELLALLFADGSVQIRQSINGGADVVASQSGVGNPAMMAIPTWKDAYLGFGGQGNTVVTASIGLRAVRSGPGTNVNTIAKARAA